MPIFTPSTGARWTRRRTLFISERTALTAVLRPAEHVSVTGGTEYDLAQGWWGTSDLFLRYGDDRFNADAGVRRYRPFFELWTIWGAFSPVPYTAIDGSVSFAITPIRLRASGERYWFDDSGAETALASFADRGWRNSLSVTARLRPTLTLDGGYHRESGPGASSRTWDGRVTWLPAPALTLSAFGSTFIRPLELRFDDAQVDAVGIDAAFRASERLEVALTGAQYFEAAPAAGRRRVRLEPVPTARPGHLGLRVRRRPPPAAARPPGRREARRAMRGLRAVLLAIGAATLIGAGGRLAARLTYDRFDHWQHRRVFPTCQGCHAGAQDSTRSIWPGANDCANCHDGTIQKKVDWSPPTGPRPTNLRFTHLVHTRKAAERLPRDSVVCTSCHLAEGAPWMRVRRTEVRRCLACHERPGRAPGGYQHRLRHLSLTLPEATALPRERIARFPTPPSHFDTSFPLAHGQLAQPPPADGGTPVGVSPSCATCHARDFCITCHVNAPEVPAIQALAPDPRSLAIETKLEAPASHAAPEFIQRHGQVVRREPQSCAACHTRESCLTCHVAQPAVAVAMHTAGPGRGQGASVNRRRPASHGDDFTDRHAPVASAAAKSCTACHARADCLDCHRPNAASAHRDTTPPGSSPAILLRHTRGRPRAQSATTPAHSAPTVTSRRGWRRAGAASRGLSRREAEIPPGARTGRAPEPGELRLVPRRARLPTVPFRRGRPALQSPRPGVRRRAAAATQSADVRGLPRERDTSTIAPGQALTITGRRGPRAGCDRGVRGAGAAQKAPSARVLWQHAGRAGSADDDLP